MQLISFEFTDRYSHPFFLLMKHDSLSKRFGRDWHNWHHGHLLASPASSSHQPLLLQKVSLVANKPKDVIEKCKIEKSVLTRDFAIWPLENSQPSKVYNFTLKLHVLCKGGSSASPSRGTSTTTTGSIQRMVTLWWGLSTRTPNTSCYCRRLMARIKPIEGTRSLTTRTGKTSTTKCTTKLSKRSKKHLKEVIIVQMCQLLYQ